MDRSKSGSSWGAKIVMFLCIVFLILMAIGIATVMTADGTNPSATYESTVYVNGIYSSGFIAGLMTLAFTDLDYKKSLIVCAATFILSAGLVAIRIFMMETEDKFTIVLKDSKHESVLPSMREFTAGTEPKVLAMFPEVSAALEEFRAENDSAPSGNAESLYRAAKVIDAEDWDAKFGVLVLGLGYLFAGAAVSFGVSGAWNMRKSASPAAPAPPPYAQ